MGLWGDLDLGFLGDLDLGFFGDLDGFFGDLDGFLVGGLGTMRAAVSAGAAKAAPATTAPSWWLWARDCLLMC